MTAPKQRIINVDLEYWSEWFRAYKTVFSALSNDDVRIGYLVASAQIDRLSSVPSHVPLGATEEIIREAYKLWKESQ